MKSSKQIWNKLAAVVLMAILLPAVTACQKDDDSDSDEKSGYLQPGTDQRPVWETAKDLYNRYDQTMSLQVTVQEELQPYISEQDMIRVTSKGETRAVSDPFNVEGEWLFSLEIAGEGSDGYLKLDYYCAKLNSIYSLELWLPFLQKTLPTDKDGRPYIVSFF